MLNQAILVGRVKELWDNALTIAVARAFKNENGEYDTDFIKAYFKEGSMSDNIHEYLNVGDIVGIKGRLATEDDNTVVYAEKVTFLSSHSNTHQDDDNQEEEEEEE